MTTYTVDAAGNGANFTTIQAAVDAADDGDIIEVAAGTYTENIQISTSGITLVSVDGRDSVTIQPLDTAVDTISINASNVTIGDVGQGFTIIGADGPPASESAAIYILSGPGTTIRDNEIVANGDSGLTAVYGTNVTGTVIDGNTFSGQTFAGDDPAGGPGFGDQFSTPNVPRQLVVIGSGGGSDVTFTNNEVTGTAGGISSTTGQPFGNQLVTIDATNSLIDGNTFTGYTTPNAYSLRVGGNGSTVTDNVIDHSVNGSDSLGIVLRPAVVTGTFSGNSFQGDGTSEPILMTPGDDAIDGGGGPDALLLAGTRAGHTIEQNPDGSYTVTDINLADGDTGSDTLDGVEGIVFGSDTFAYELDANSPDFSAALERFSADFETDASAFVENGSALAVEPSGANGVTTADGASHLRVGTSDQGGAFTRFGGYGQGDTGFVTQVKVFLDTDMDAGEGFDWSVAANNESGAHMRDFVIHVTKDTDSGNIIIGADNNTNFAPQLNLETKNHAAVGDSGWYTFEHKFYENEAGALEVAMNVYDDAGNWVFTEVRSDPADDFATDFGGSRYGWFTNVDVDGGIAVDSVSLKTLDQNLVEVRDGNTVLGTFATIEEAKEAADNGDISGATLQISTFGQDDAFFYVVDGMSIQDAVDASQEGGTVEVASGTYAENVVIDKELDLVGVGNDVIIEGTFKSSNGLAEGASVADFLKTAGAYTGAAGSGITVSADNVSISNILVSSFLAGVTVNADVDNLGLDGVSVDGSVFGFEKLGNAALSNFTMNGGTISDAYIGVYFYASTAAPTGLASDIVIDGTTFSHLTQKGLYIETLQDAVIKNIIMNDVGQYGGGPAFGANGAHGAGIDINLKYDGYSGITIEDFVFTNVGLSNGLGTPHANAAAIAVKARDDAASYNGDPASFDGEVIIRNGSITGTSTGIRAGEAGKTVNDPAVTITDVTVSGNVSNANHGAVDNVTNSEMTINLVDGGATLAVRAGATGDFIINGGDGNDQITGALGSDVLSGGDGMDTLRGGNGADFLFGGGDNDTIFGGQGNDTLNGGDGDDTLNGEGNADRFLFSAGEDTVNGGNGSDTMVLFGSASDYQITIGPGAGNYTFERLSDGSVTTATSIEIIQFQQEPPDAQDDTLAVDTGDVRSLDVLANDTPSGQLDVIAATLQSGNGSVSIGPGGNSIQYNLAGQYVGLDQGETATATIDYLVMDTAGNVDGATATITVNGVNDAVGVVTDTNGASDTVMENLAAGATVGITAQAIDPDTNDTVTYSLTDDSNGEFVINAITGVVTTAVSLDREGGDATRSITVQATDGDTVSSRTFTIAIGDVNDASVSTPIDADGTTGGAVAENAASGTAVGITALATDPDATNNGVTYSLSDNDGGRFAIDSGTGVVTLVGALNREIDGASRSITVVATSQDGSSANQTFSIAVNDVDEFDVSTITDTDDDPGGQVTENAANGTSVGITALASDADATNNTITYSLDDNDGGRFIISSTTGEVLVAGPIDREDVDGEERAIVVRATSSDGSFSTQSFTIAVDDIDEFNVSTPVDSDPASNSVAVSAAIGTYTGVTAAATDADATTNAVTYAILGGTGEFSVDALGKINVASALNPAGGSTRLVTVQATSADGSTSQETFTINVTGSGLIVSGTPGRDIISGSEQDDQIDGLGGNDDLFGLGGADTLVGGDGNDRLDGGTGDDTMTGGDGNDTYTVDSAGDVVIETSTGGANDIVNSSATIAALFANVEKLFLTGSANIDGTGNELSNRIDGNSGNNTLRGEDGNDTLSGLDGADTLYGGLGSDTLSGDAGADTLNGGLGKDNLTGGAGADKFVFDLAPSGADTDKIFDFSHADGDKIVFSASAFPAIGPSLEASEFRLGTSANAATNRVIYDQPTGRLWYDADGNGSTSPILVATLQNQAVLGVDDFEILA